MPRSVEASSGARCLLEPGRRPRALPIRLAAAAGSVALTMTLLPARTLTVDDDGPADYRVIQNAIDAAAAGGVAALHSDATVSNNSLSGNDADYGGGLHVEGGAPRITRNLITGNTAGAGGGVDAYVLPGTDAVIAANTITSNTAKFGGGLELGGYGVPVLINNVIVGNT